MENNYNSEIIDEALNSQELTDKINEALPLQVKIMSDYKQESKDLCDEFCLLMARSNPAIYSIYMKRKKNRTEEEQEDLKNFLKQTKRKFKTLMKLLHPKEGKDPIGAMIEKLVDITKFLDYLKKDDLNARFSAAGIHYDFEPLEKTNKYFADEKIKPLFDDLFNRGDDLYNGINETNNVIENDIYGSLEENLIYSPANPEGMTKSQFKKLLKTKAKGQLDDPDKYDVYKTKLINKETANIISQTMTVEKMKEI